ncbi:hypothetical protein V5G24_23085 [Xanthobacter sp. VTT E-85241]|uniref:hypothetical protein n=1 Tax=Roseixanthobacter finlandensis TaxID=3119922 RepID=UPI003726A5FE
MQPGLFVESASAILRVCKMPHGEYSADDMNMVVSFFPEAEEVLRIWNMPLDEVPIIFSEVSFEAAGRLMINQLRKGEPFWPMFHLPVALLDGWSESIPYKTLQAFMISNDLDIALSIGPERYMIRSEDVHLASLRLRFTRGYNWCG